MKNKEDILKKLFALQRFGIKPGLERTLKLSNHFGNPHTKFKSIHVAGTNGKGAVCSLMASILMEAGYKVGLYSSPHIIDFNERMRINGKKISDKKLLEYSQQFLPQQEKFENTFFELTTVMAFKYFAAEDVDIALIETGMGGRYDSTNIITPIASVITKIDVDHTQYIGKNLNEIAEEKSGIIKKSIPVFVSGENEDIRNIFIEKADSENSTIFFTYQDLNMDKIKFNNDFSIDYDYEMDDAVLNIHSPLSGEHQVRNLNLVLLAANRFQKLLNIQRKHILEGIKNVRNNSGYYARFENIQKFFPERTHPVILDAAHNPNAMFALKELVITHNNMSNKWTIVFASMKDKDYKSMLENIKDFTDKLILTDVTVERCEKANILEQTALKIGFENISVIVLKSEILEYISNNDIPTIITGSFYLIGEIVEELNKTNNYLYET